MLSLLKRFYRKFGKYLMRELIASKFGKIFLEHRFIKDNLSMIKYMERNKLDSKGEEILNFLKNNKLGIYSESFIKQWLVTENGENYLDIRGAKLPDITNNKKMSGTFTDVFRDTFLVPCICNDNYDKSIVKRFYKKFGEGPYGYRDLDNDFDVTVHAGDIVIDAGAWIGDFSAYAVSNERGGVTAYAFEPAARVFELLCSAAKLNNNKIVPVEKGLGKENSEVFLYYSNEEGPGSSLLNKGQKQSRKIAITTLDNFVEKENIPRVDFIKADIEGAERDMLMGAGNVLKKFAPKLAICTYHLSDDPEVLEKIILDFNPNYKIVQCRKKLFACVPSKK